MTSYIATVSARDLGEAARADHTSRAEVPRGIAPRMASAHEPWTIMSVETPIPNGYPHPYQPAESVERNIERAQPLSLNRTDDNPIAAERLSAPIMDSERAESAKPSKPSPVTGHGSAIPRVQPVIQPREFISAREPNASKPSALQHHTDRPVPVRPQDDRRIDDVRRLNPDRDTQRGAGAPSNIALPRHREVVTVVPRRSELRADQYQVRDVKPTGAGDPTVVVTIGRIDVRAVTTTQTTSHTARGENKSMMSLEDYLQQRVRGAR
jgi:hypothetical protein